MHSCGGRVRVRAWVVLVRVIPPLSQEGARGTTDHAGFNHTFPDLMLACTPLRPTHLLRRFLQEMLRVHYTHLQEPLITLKQVHGLHVSAV